MRMRLRRSQIFYALTMTIGVVCLWLVASTQSGFPVLQILMFAGPGIVLALAVSWASHAATPRALTWRHGLHAALYGAAFFPPFVGLYFAWGGSFGASVLVTLLVFSTWFALMVGFIVATIRLLQSKEERRLRARLPRPPHPYEITQPAVGAAKVRAQVGVMR